ncbi:MAG: hypothetical protein AAFO82_13630 [Bacteroidota bacterium]
MNDHIIKSPIRAEPILEYGLDQENYFTDLSQEDADIVRSNTRLEIDFRREELQELIDLPEYIGIRLYPAFDSNGKASLSVNGIGEGTVNMFKREDFSVDRILDLTVENFPDSGLTENKSYISEGMTAATKGSEAQKNRDHNIINNLIALAKNQGISAETLFPFCNDLGIDNIPNVIFSSQSIAQLLSKEKVIGLRFCTVKIQVLQYIDFNDEEIFKNYKTFAVAPVNDLGEEGNMILSSLPCPPNCAGGGSTFAPPPEEDS